MLEKGYKYIMKKMIAMIVTMSNAEYKVCMLYFNRLHHCLNDKIIKSKSQQKYIKIFKKKKKYKTYKY